MGVGRSRSWWLACVIASSVVVGVGPAAAAAPAVAGGAFALSIRSSSTTVVPPTPAGVAGSGTTFPLIRADSPALGVAGIATVAGLRASTDGSSGAVTSSASVDTLSLVGGLVGAGPVSSVCTATALGAQGGAIVSSLSVAGSALPVTPAPNTTIDVAGVVKGVLNEQVRDAGAGTSGLTVRAAHLQVRTGNAGSALLDVVVAESRCTVETGGPPASTTIPAGPTTTGPPQRTTTTLQSGTTTTTPSSTTTTEPAGAPTTLPPTGTAAAPADEPVQTVRAETVDGRQAGPSGSELTVAGSGFESCADVEIRFDDHQIGVAHPDDAGRLADRALSVPGDARAGVHEVVASCRSQGLLRATAAFQVVADEGPHRTAFVTSLAAPSQVGTDARSLLASAVGALAMLLAIAFPSQLFNSTLDENYDEVRGWFGFRKAHHDDSLRHQVVEFVGFVVLGGLLYGLLSPGLGFDRSSAALVIGLSLSLVVVSLGFRIPHMLYVHHRDGEWGRLRVLPGTAAVAVVCVAISRLTHFQPGYLYGLIAGLAIRRQLGTETSGALTAVSAVSVFALSLAAWFARVPVSAAAAGAHPSIWILALEASLAAITVLGIETVVICLIPLRFVDGSKLAAWSRTAWAVIFGLAAFGFVHILLRPDSGYVAAGASRLTVVVLFVAFGLFSVAFWAYFRFRPARELAPA